jgi:tetratricopeptide (TPR) repeat protein
MLNSPAIPSLSLCMIVKNEADVLPRSLSSAAGLTDELIVVDTGSTDATVGIAQKYGAKVFLFEWRDDFAAARNFALEQATGDWIVVLDADEEIDPRDFTAIRAMAQNSRMEGCFWRVISLITPTDKTSGLICPIFRMFRNRPAYRYTGRIHEHVLNSILKNTSPETIGYLPVTLYHYGYLPEVRQTKKKSVRNRNLLRQELQEAGPSAPLLYYLGNEHFGAGEYSEALKHYRDALSLDQDGQYVQVSPRIRQALLMSLIMLNRWQEVITIVPEFLQKYPDYPDLYFQLGYAWVRLKQPFRALRSFTTCLKIGEASNGNYATISGVGSFLAWHEIGAIHLITDRPQLARLAFQENIRLNQEKYDFWLDLARPFATGLNLAGEWLELKQFCAGLRLSAAGKILFARAFSQLHCWTEIYEIIHAIDRNDLDRRQTAFFDYLLGCSLLYQNRGQEAIACWERIPPAPDPADLVWLILLRKIEHAWSRADFDTAGLLTAQLTAFKLPEPKLSQVYEQLQHYLAWRHELSAAVFEDATMFAILSSLMRNLALLRSTELLEQIMQTAWRLEAYSQVDFLLEILVSRGQLTVARKSLAWSTGVTDDANPIILNLQAKLALWAGNKKQALKLFQATDSDIAATAAKRHWHSLIQLVKSECQNTLRQMTAPTAKNQPPLTIILP